MRSSGTCVQLLGLSEAKSVGSIPPGPRRVDRTLAPRPPRRRDSSPRNGLVAAVAAPLPASSYPSAGEDARSTLRSNLEGFISARSGRVDGQRVPRGQERRPRDRPQRGAGEDRVPVGPDLARGGVVQAATRPRNIQVAAAAPPRPVRGLSRQRLPPAETRSNLRGRRAVASTKSLNVLSANDSSFSGFKNRCTSTRTGAAAPHKGAPAYLRCRPMSAVRAPLLLIFAALDCLRLDVHSEIRTSRLDLHSAGVREARRRHDERHDERRAARERRRRGGGRRAVVAGRHVRPARSPTAGFERRAEFFSRRSPRARAIDVGSMLEPRRRRHRLKRGRRGPPPSRERAELPPDSRRRRLERDGRGRKNYGVAQASQALPHRRSSGWTRRWTCQALGQFCAAALRGRRHSAVVSRRSRRPRASGPPVESAHAVERREQGCVNAGASSKQRRRRRCNGAKSVAIMSR